MAVSKTTQKLIFIFPLFLLITACSAALPTISEKLGTDNSIQASPFPTLAPSISTLAPTEAIIPTSSLPTNRPYRLVAGELQLAASPDDIPAIFANDALFVDASAGDAEWQDEEGVIGVFINGEARAYPIRLLSLHEVVNDTVGGQPIVVTWCPLCYTAMVFNRVVDGQEFTFGVSGFLFHNNLVMYDHQSETLWSQLLAQGIRGAYSRSQLTLIGASQSTWAAWKAAHPDTRILSAIQMGKASEEIIDPYVGYYLSGAAGLGGQAQLDDRLAPKELVLGLRVGREKLALPFGVIRDVGLINHELGELPILFVYNAQLNYASAFSRQTEAGALTFEFNANGDLIDLESQSIWDIESGLAIAGPRTGLHLSRLTAPIVFWFAWSDIYPETSVYLLSE